MFLKKIYIKLAAMSTMNRWNLNEFGNLFQKTIIKNLFYHLYPAD